MENKTEEINLEVMEYFNGRFPDLNIVKPRMARLGVAEEFRRLKVGEIVLFPIDSYNYQTIRSTPATSMVPEAMNEGRQWKTRLDKANRSVAVIRIA